MIVNNYQPGDKVYVKHGTHEAPGRVIRVNSGVRVALYLPERHEFDVNRIAPAGTPAFWVVDPADVRLHERDPGWNPWSTIPPMTPADYQVISGLPRTSDQQAVAHVGAYLDAASYAVGDPVWVWDNGWQPASVVGVDAGWIAVRPGNGATASARSYRSKSVWPVICDFPEAMTHVLVDPHDLQGRHYLCAEAGECVRPGESGCGPHERAPLESELPASLRVARLTD